MRPEVQRELVTRFRALRAERTTPLADAPLRVDTTAYTSPVTAAAERRALFRDRPVVACLSADVRDPGDTLATEVDGCPILVVRDHEGTVRVFHNACRHRGAPVATGRGHADRVLTCPYHAWSYRLDGALHRQPLARGNFDVGETLDLHPIPSGEAAGLVLVHLGGRSVDSAAWLGGLADDLDSYGIAEWHHAETRSQTLPMNWKLVVDSFLEGYHIFSLHSGSIAPAYYSQPGLFDSFGPHFRHIGVRRSIEGLGDDETTWTILPHATIHHVVFPNTLVVHQLDHLEVWRIFPGEHPGDSLIDTTVYAPNEPDERMQRRWEKNLDILLHVTGTEDFPLLEKSFRNMVSGGCPEIVFGRNEIALVHLHTQIEQALATAVEVRP